MVCKKLDSDKVVKNLSEKLGIPYVNVRKAMGLISPKSDSKSFDEAFAKFISLHLDCEEKLVEFKASLKFMKTLDQALAMAQTIDKRSFYYTLLLRKWSNLTYAEARKVQNYLQGYTVVTFAPPAGTPATSFAIRKWIPHLVKVSSLNFAATYTLPGSKEEKLIVQRYFEIRKKRKKKQ